MKAIRIIEKVASSIAPGPFISFTQVHVFKAMGTIGEGREVGRAKLSRTLGIGEGATRTLLRHLRKEGLIKVTKRGCTFTEKGREIFDELRAVISDSVEVPRGSYTTGRYNIALLVRGAARVLVTGVEQRDDAIKAGAQGAITLLYAKERLLMPGVEEDPFEREPHIRDLLLLSLKPREGSVVVIGFAEDKRMAELGARAAALGILKKSA